MLSRFGLRLIVVTKTYDAILLDHGKRCDCELCIGGNYPSIFDVLDTRLFFLSFRLPATTKTAQKEAQSSELEAMEDWIDQQQCSEPVESFEVETLRPTQLQLLQYRNAIDVLDLRPPVEPTDVRPTLGNLNSEGPSRATTSSIR